MNALYTLYDALVSINVPTDRARAVVTAMEQEMTTVLATKADLAATQLLLRQEIAAFRDSLHQKIDSVETSLRLEIELLRSSLTVRLGTMLFLGMGALFAALKLT
ncbi:MAG: hypothetical protein QM718_06795 [Steroidobacteraceae bacterium]